MLERGPCLRFFFQTVALLSKNRTCVLQHHAHIHAAITMRFASPRCRTPRENWLRVETIQTITAAHRRYPSSLPAATLHGKTQGFVLRLPPQNTPHATWMQPLQCVLQRHVHIHAALTMPFASPRCRTWQQNMTVIMQSASQVSTSLRHHFPRWPLP